MNRAIAQELIVKKIFYVRGQKVLLDKDLARLYAVPVKRLNEQVKRNIARFPGDFMFQLNKGEAQNLKSHFATSSWGGIRKSPFAFTEQGVAMLSSVLSSDRAIKVNIQIMRTFTRLREVLNTHKELRQKIDELFRVHGGKLKDHDKKFEMVFAAIQQLLIGPEPEKKKKFGFIADRSED